jgi:radical SAM protein with 4Fe4S-binding SPASM domain
MICGAGVNSFHISATGMLGVCATSREPNYDLRKGTFRDGFYRAIPELRARRRTRQSECQLCPMGDLCGQYPGWGNPARAQ